MMGTTVYELFGPLAFVVYFVASTAFWTVYVLRHGREIIGPGRWFVPRCAFFAVSMGMEWPLFLFLGFPLWLLHVKMLKKRFGEDAVERFLKEGQ